VAAVSTATAITTMTSTSAPSSSSSSLEIGLGVALGVVILAVAAMGLVLYRRHRGRHGDGPWGGSPTGFMSSYDAPNSELEQPNMIHEIPSRWEPVEMDGGVGRR
jgi:hypothetical protein